MLFIVFGIHGNQDEDSDDTPTDHRSIKDDVIHGVEVVGTKVKPVLQHVQSGVKTGLKTGVQGVKSGVASVKSGVQTVSNLWTAFRNKKAIEHASNDQSDSS